MAVGSDMKDGNDDCLVDGLMISMAHSLACLCIRAFGRNTLILKVKKFTTLVQENYYKITCEVACESM